tara:strand:- start:1307 stop:2053 length:747 start_codon:yes stop_codon:yes gene_type:complete
MKFNFKNKTIVITGASRGIGKDIAINFANLNANLVLISRNIMELTKLKKQLNNKSNTILPLQLDVSCLDDFIEATKIIEKKFGSIDILINNAGITKDNLILRLKESDWDSVINVNLKGCFNGLKAVTKYMMKQKSGKIINISSIVGLTGNIGQANYAASKAGIIGLTKSAAKELGSRNIQVNAIAPGYIETEMTDKLNEETKENFINKIPLNKFGEVSDISNLVLFLASNNSNYITGQTITIDGGLTI